MYKTARDVQFAASGDSTWNLKIILKCTVFLSYKFTMWTIIEKRQTWFINPYSTPAGMWSLYQHAAEHTCTCCMHMAGCPSSCSASALCLAIFDISSVFLVLTYGYKHHPVTRSSFHSFIMNASLCEVTQWRMDSMTTTALVTHPRTQSQ